MTGPVTSGGASGGVHHVGLLAVGTAAPALRLPGAELRTAWGSGGGRTGVAVCDADEDTLTLAWEAGVAALAAAGVEPGEVSGLWWGTSRPPFAEGPSHAVLCTALGLDPGATGGLCSGSPHAGIDALVAAWDALACGHAHRALVIASDALVPGLGTAAESVTGAGAVALLLGPAAASNGASVPARLVARATRMLPVVDRYRGDGEPATNDIYDGRLFREEVYLPLLARVGAQLAEDERALGGWALSDPDGKLAPALAARLGAPLISAPVTTALGDTAAAAPLLGLVPALVSVARPAGQGPADASRRGSEGPETVVLGAIGYGGGRASALLVQLARPVPGAERLDDVLAGGREVSYLEAIKARGQLEALSEPVAMGVPPGSAAFVRGNVEMLGLHGGLCRACGTISTPPSIHPTCTGCGRGGLEVVALARRGTVQTLVVNQTMPPPFQAPLPLVVVDLEDGARLMVQGVPADAQTLEIGDDVELRLRRYATERGVPVYGYKAVARRTRADETRATAMTGASEEGR